MLAPPSRGGVEGRGLRNLPEDVAAPRLSCSARRRKAAPAAPQQVPKISVDIAALVVSTVSLLVAVADIWVIERRATLEQGMSERIHATS
jgi:hypothetical protein